MTRAAMARTRTKLEEPLKNVARQKRICRNPRHQTAPIPKLAPEYQFLRVDKLDRIIVCRDIDPFARADVACIA
jgi:hypothetical protein